MTNTVFNVLVFFIVFAIVALFLWRTHRKDNTADLPVREHVANALGKQLADEFDRQIIKDLIRDHGFSSHRVKDALAAAGMEVVRSPNDPADYDLRPKAKLSDWPHKSSNQFHPDDTRYAANHYMPKTAFAEQLDEVNTDLPDEFHTLPVLKAHGKPQPSDHRKGAMIFNLGARTLAKDPHLL